MRDTVAVDSLVGVLLWHDDVKCISQWQGSDFLALGMLVHAHLPCARGMLGLVNYAIHDYKPVLD